MKSVGCKVLSGGFRVKGAECKVWAMMIVQGLVPRVSGLCLTSKGVLLTA